jgi:hypothetical protein
MPKTNSELKTGRLSVNVTGSVMERLQEVGDILGQPPAVIASICIGMGLKALEAQVKGLDPRLMAQVQVEYQTRMGIQPLSQEQMMRAMVQGFADLPPEQLAKLGMGPEQLERLANGKPE